MKRAWPVLLTSLLGYAAIEAAVFHSGLYARYVAPDSTTGQLETKLHNEDIGPKDRPNQFLAIGDSRMALVPRVFDMLARGSRDSLGSIALGGTTPRVWYYALREMDPDANRYQGIFIGLDSFDDAEIFEDYAQRESDLNYLLHRLRLGDLWEFSRSYREPASQWRAARGIVFKGSVYQRDFQQFLLAPRERIAFADQSRRDSHNWQYDYIESDQSLAGLTVDWENKTLVYPPRADPGLEPMLRRNLLEPLPEPTGRHGAYLKYWLTRIVERYRGSETRIVFLRLARGPWIRPDLPPENPNSFVRTIDQPNVGVAAEDLFNFLERPEYFRDPLHLNRAGLEAFTKTVWETMRGK